MVTDVRSSLSSLPSETQANMQCHHCIITRAPGNNNTSGVSKHSCVSVVLVGFPLHSFPSPLDKNHLLTGRSAFALSRTYQFSKLLSD